MPGMMNRASTIVKAKINKLLNRAEDPGETLDYSYEKQLELLQNVKRGVADVVTSKKRLEMQTSTLEQSVLKLDGQDVMIRADNSDIKFPFRAIANAKLVLTFKNIKPFVFPAVPMRLGPSGGLHNGFEYRIRSSSLLSLYFPAAFRVRWGIHRLQLAVVWFCFLRPCV